MRIWYYSFDEASDDEGFFICTVESERKCMEEAGAPLEGVTFLKIEPEDRDDAIATVEATPAFIEWLDKEGITWDTEGA